MMSEDRGSVRLDLLPDKIRSGHRERLAIVLSLSRFNKMVSL